jgi:glycosyltransferase involved in cell wall biosynthesis
MNSDTIAGSATLPSRQADTASSTAAGVGTARKTRVMVVIGSLEIGGAQKHVYDLLRSMSRDKYEFHVVTLTSNGFYYDQVRQLDVTLHSLDIKGRYELVARFGAFLRLVRRIRPDVLHLFLFHSSIYGVLAAVLTRPSPAVVYSKRSMGLEISAFRRFVYRYIVMSRADAVTAVSQPVGEECIKLGASPALVRVVENGIEWTHQPERGLLRKTIGVPEGVPLVGMVGSMTFRKRQHLLIEAAPAILAQNPDVHFVILGDGVLRAKLEEQVRQLGLTDRVHLPGVLAPATRYLADLSVFALTSSEEGTSNALLEAMMIGVPVVCSDIPSNRQVLTDRQEGRLVAGDPRQLADAVLELLHGGPAVAEMVSRGKERVAGRYLLDACAAENASVYDQVVASQRERNNLPQLHQA